MALIDQTARALVARLRASEISIAELLQALEKRIDAVDGTVNALPTRCFERAYSHAERLQRKPVEERGLLAGLPVAIKDLSEVEGVRTTHGSRIFEKHIPTASDHIVEQIEREGGVVYAKSNTPEFGAGGNTFNDVFGATVNPWNTERSAAGSSGGAAAALASGTAWLAQGSDMGGSLRNPASFCGVVGFRPSPGRVPQGPQENPYGTLSVNGPMARNVDDVALFFDALCAFDAREPLSFDPPPVPFREAAAARIAPKRVAFSADLGITPVDQQVAALCRRAAERFEAMGAVVEESHPDLADAHQAFQVLRAQDFAEGMAGLLREHRDLLKPEIIWNIEKGLALTAEDIAHANAQRGAMAVHARAFFETYDLLVAPATIVPAFPVGQRYLESCNGVVFETYIDWLAIAYAITLVSLPALAMPCGLTEDGLPVGVQLIGKPRGEAALLSAAGCLEDALGLPLVPIDPRPGKVSRA